MGTLFICCSCKEYGGDAAACSNKLGSPCLCECHVAIAEKRLRMRDFATDSEQHAIDKDVWSLNNRSFAGVVLYSHGGFFTAYYDDAGELWGRMDDDKPAFHVMVKSDPPHRLVIAPEDLVAWVEYLAEICLPVTILGREE